jgi:DNA-binding MarR family transcriptional regulator
MAQGAKIALGSQRHCIQKMVLKLLRISHAAYLPGHHFAADIDQLILLIGIFIGQVEGRPFTAAKLAIFLDIPRTTLLRRLAGMEKEGIIAREDHRYHMASSKLADQVTSCRQQIRTIQNAALELSKMDNKPVG